MAMRVVDVLVPVALDQTYSYRVPEGLELAPGDVVTVPLGARGETTGVVWAENDNPNPRFHNRMKDVVAKARRSAAAARAAPVRRLGRGLHAVGARHGAAHGVADGRAFWAPAASASASGWQGPAPARMTPARARVLHVFADGMVARQRRRGERSRRQRRRPSMA